jgi:hypothetical protein
MSHRDIAVVLRTTDTPENRAKYAAVRRAVKKERDRQGLDASGFRGPQPELSCTAFGEGNNLFFRSLVPSYPLSFEEIIVGRPTGVYAPSGWRELARQEVLDLAFETVQRMRRQETPRPAT